MQDATLVIIAAVLIVDGVLLALIYDRLRKFKPRACGRFEIDEDDSTIEDTSPPRFDGNNEMLNEVSGAVGGF